MIALRVNSLSRIIAENSSDTVYFINTHVRTQGLKGVIELFHLSANICAQGRSVYPFRVRIFILVDIWPLSPWEYQTVCLIWFACS